MISTVKERNLHKILKLEIFLDKSIQLMPGINKHLLTVPLTAFK